MNWGRHRGWKLGELGKVKQWNLLPPARVSPAAWALECVRWTEADSLQA